MKSFSPVVIIFGASDQASWIQGQIVKPNGGIV
jgi:hypothetical protein